MAKTRLTRRTFFGRMASAGLATAIAPATLHDATRAPFPWRSGIEADGFLLCVFSKHLQFVDDYAELSDVVAQIGFDGVDLTVRPEGHVEPAAVERDLPRAVEAIRAAGLGVPTITTDITSVDEENARAVLETAASLGIPRYRMGYVHYESALGVAARLEMLRPQLEELAALNEELGIHGAYQNHDGRYVGSPVWDLALALDGIDPSWLGVQYDIRHATVEGANTWPLGLDLLAPRIHSLVVKDFRWMTSEAAATVEDVPLGRGHVDYAAFWQQIKSLNIRRPVSVHFEYAMPGSLEPLSAADLRNQTAEVMQRDLTMLRKMLVQAGM